MKIEDQQFVLAREVDDRRRLTMPENCPAESAVTIQELDEETWIVRLHRPKRTKVMTFVRDCKCAGDHKQTDWDVLKGWPLCAGCREPWKLKQPVSDTPAVKVT